jgi:FtsZ-binding cell division protein ZapB
MTSQPLTSNLDTPAVQVDKWLTLEEAARLVGRSEKSLRRYIKQGKIDNGAVYSEPTATGFRYRVNPGAIPSLKAALAGRVSSYPAPLEHIASKLDEGLDKVAQRFEEAVQPLREQVEALTRALPPAEEEREALQATIRQVHEETAAVQTRLDTLADEMRSLRGELAALRRPWWKRLFQGGREGPDA